MGLTSTTKDFAPPILTNTRRQFNMAYFFFTKLRKLNERSDLLAEILIKFILYSEGYTFILVAWL